MHVLNFRAEFIVDQKPTTLSRLLQNYNDESNVTRGRGRGGGEREREFLLTKT